MYFPEESNRYGLGVLPDRDALVADAAGNDIIRVLPRGDVTTMARFDLVAMVVFHQHQRADGVGILCGIELRNDPTEREPDQRVRLFSSDCCEHGLKVVYYILAEPGVGAASLLRMFARSYAFRLQPEPSEQIHPDPRSDCRRPPSPHGCESRRRGPHRRATERLRIV